MYHLHGRLVRPRATGPERSIYYFSRYPGQARDALPDGCEIREAPSGLPMLKQVAAS